MKSGNSTRAITSRIRHAEEVCEDQGAALTPLRRDVYELLLRHDRPVGAYELLDELKSLRPKAAPVTVYRALDFLLERGLVHRVNALNAFSACRGHEADHRGLVLICRSCKATVELEDHKVDNTIRKCAAELGFETGDGPVEVLGMCAACRAA